MGADGRTLDEDEAYENIVQSSRSYTQGFKGEPVPRFSKRSPDFVLQGSNNTLISLGTDRSSAEGTSISDSDKNEFSGTIDIVAGRGVTDSAGSLIPRDSKDSFYFISSRDF